MTGLKKPQNSAITLFGGSGDLTYRKLLPAMYNLHVLNQLDENFKIIAIGRREYTTKNYIEISKKWVEEFSRKKFDEEKFQEFAKRITYFKMDISVIEQYEFLQQFYQSNCIENHIYYYAVAPSFFLPITKGLEKYCRDNHAKVIIEKPFGEDLETAEKLNESLAQFFGQDEIYHIDHYLGKEMIQNILSIRFKNAIFKGIWNRDFIDHIQISALESVGVGSRAGYYDKSGALKDMVQNHLLQLLSIVTLEESDNQDFSSAQFALLNSLRPIENIEENLVMGQYAGYLDELNIAPNSKTETYVALKLFIDNERFKDVPIYIRTGKKMNNRESQVVIKFKPVGNQEGNVLIIKIQPDEGVYLQFNAKKPGSEQEIQKVTMDFCQSCVLENRINTPEAYERLLFACMNGDRSLFSKWDQIALSWHFINDLLDKYKNSDQKLYIYEPNSEGPKKAESLIQWIN